MIINGHHDAPSAAAATGSTGMSYVCLFYYTNDYLKVAITTNGGWRAQDVLQNILSLKYVFFSYVFILFITLMII